jgi:tRNA(adenine34) deaminase
MAIGEAECAMNEEEVPVGAIITSGNSLVSKGYNQIEKLTDPTAHAEILAISAATEFYGNKSLSECTLYVTLEPCVMCAGALYWTQLGKLVIGASDPKRGFLRIGTQLLHPKTQVVENIRSDECSDLLKAFFEKRR